MKRKAYPSPEAHERWNMRLLADKVVELGYCKRSSTETRIRCQNQR